MSCTIAVNAFELRYLVQSYLLLVFLSFKYKQCNTKVIPTYKFLFTKSSKKYKFLNTNTFLTYDNLLIGLKPVFDVGI